jgi:hypothetical protein
MLSVDTFCTFHDANAVRYIRGMGKVLMEEDPDVDMCLFTYIYAGDQSRRSGLQPDIIASLALGTFFPIEDRAAGFLLGRSVLLEVRPE